MKVLLGACLVVSIFVLVIALIAGAPPKRIVTGLLFFTGTSGFVVAFKSIIDINREENITVQQIEKAAAQIEALKKTFLETLESGEEVDPTLLTWSPEPIYAWRTWSNTTAFCNISWPTYDPSNPVISYAFGQLVGNYGGRWKTTKLDAECNFRHLEVAPAWNCQCGIYAYKLEYAPKNIFFQFFLCIGLVKLSGKVIEHEDGYRAQHAEIVKLYIPHQDATIKVNLNKDNDDFNIEVNTRDLNLEVIYDIEIEHKTPTARDLAQDVIKHQGRDRTLGR